MSVFSGLCIMTCFCFVVRRRISDVRWSGEDIVVLDHVTISPPYDVNSCKSSDVQALQHVQKLVGELLYFIFYIDVNRSWFNDYFNSFSGLIF